MLVVVILWTSWTQVLVVAMANINKDWKFEDIFNLSKVELDKLKVQTAN